MTSRVAFVLSRAPRVPYRGRMSDVAFEVAEVASLPPGKGRSIQVGNRRLALFNVEGRFHVIDDDCPHRGGPLGPGWFEGCRVHCPLHGWAFDVTTGACDVRPDRPVRTYPAEVRGDRVWVLLPPA